MSETINKIKRGYLKEDFMFFHLKDQSNKEFQLHYHEFNKVVIFIAGNVTYLVEGKAYKLKPWDVIFVGENELHKPIIDPCSVYERYIIWINSNFLNDGIKEKDDLLSCFKITSDEKINLLRIDEQYINKLRYSLSELEKSIYSDEFGAYTMKVTNFKQLMVYMNRVVLGMDMTKANSDIKYDDRVQKLISYINEHLEEELTIDILSKEFYQNRYYLMHLFKEQTGYTIHKYIQKKRLIRAGILIRDGEIFSDVCKKCGFGDYSAFLRAFRKEYGVTPREYVKILKESNL